MNGGLLLVEGDAQGLRAALMRDRRLQAIEIDDTAHPSLVGAVTQAKAVRTLPGLGTLVVLPDGTELLLDRGRDKTIPVSGEVLTVQVTRGPIGEKLGLATRDIALNGRAVIYLPKEFLPKESPSPLRGEGRGEGAAQRAPNQIAMHDSPRPPHPDPLPATRGR